MQIGKLDKRITVYRPVVTENDYGENVLQSRTVVTTFRAMVESQPSDTSLLPIDMHRQYQTNEVKIVTRKSFVELVDIDDELEISDETGVWQVKNTYGTATAITTGRTRFSEIVAQKIN